MGAAIMVSQMEKNMEAGMDAPAPFKGIQGYVGILPQ